MMLADLIKHSLTLLVLIDPISVLPFFLTAVAGLSCKDRLRFARNLSMFVAAALVIVSFMGLRFLQMLGVSLGAMQIGGGTIALLMAIAMVFGHEVEARSTRNELRAAGASPSLVPLGLPLLLGPAALSYAIVNGRWDGGHSLILDVVPALAAGAFTYAVFFLGLRFSNALKDSTRHLIERLSGFVLAMLSVEIISQGLKAMFPLLR